MHRTSSKHQHGLPTLLFVLCLAPPMRGQESGERFKNLKVLPPDISEEELDEAMLDNLRGLGLRRLAGEGCLFCHVGNLEQPRSSWDWASDEKPTKRKARVMMEMVQAINDRHLPQLENRIDSTHRVTCHTCHSGRTDPRPLPDILWESYEAGGIDSATTRYRALRDRYFGADAYDFRVGVLTGLATQLADRDAIDDAVAMAALNVDVNPNDVAAKQGWVRFVLERTMNANGVQAALGELERMEPDLDEGVVSPGLLDGLAWRIYRKDRKEEAVTILRDNLERFPQEYVPNESMAFVLFDGGDKASAFRLLERWIENHPDHDRARRLLVNLRAR